MLFLRGIKDDIMEALNLIGKGNISKMDFDGICDICRNYSRSQRLGRNYPSKLYSMGTSTGITKCEIGNLLEDLKTNLISHMGK